MSTEYNTYECLFLNSLDDIPIGNYIQGNIYNLCRTRNNVYGVGIDPITHGIVYESNSRTKIYGATADGIFACRIGAFIEDNKIYDDLAPQYIINIEKNSILDNFFEEHGARKLPQVKITPKKYLVPTEVKNFMSYTTFDSRIADSEKYISCPLEFKLKGYRYRGFDFLYRPNSVNPEYITLYRYDDNNFAFTPNDFVSEFGGELFEIIDEREVAGTINGWLMGYLETYVDPNMTINCYKYSSQYNRVDKSDYLESVIDIVGIPRKGFMLTHPSFTIELDSPPKFNYVYIEKLNRYFFVEDFIYLTYNLYEIRLKVDVLMTYKDGLKKLNAFIDRNQHTYNEKLIDKRYIFEQGIDVEQIIVPQNSSSPNWLRNVANWENEFCFIINGYKINAVGTN